MQVFATEDGASATSRYSMADMRYIPVRARREGFCRATGGWVPAPGVAARVLLGPPAGRVDMVVLRGEVASVPGGSYGGYVRPGGHVLVLGGKPEGLLQDPRLELVGGGPFLRRVCTRDEEE